MKKVKIKKFFEILSNASPEPKTELKYSSKFQLLIAVILSAQTTDIAVNKVTKKLFKFYPNAEKLKDAEEHKILEIIRTVGLAPTKAKNLRRTSELIFKNHNGIAPKTRKELEILPGVGRKTASVVLNEAFNLPFIGVDTHVFRVSNRTGLSKGKNVIEVEEGLMNSVPNEWKLKAHQLLILHGRYVCKAKNPDCLNCIVSKLCEFKKNDKIIY